MGFFIGLLDCENATHKYILHYVFLPRINYVLSSFVSSWNNHPLRTERNWSPLKIWTNGMMDRRNHHITHIAEIQGSSSDDSIDNLTWYGMDWSAPSPMDDGLSIVVLDDLNSPLTENQNELISNIDPIALSSSFGIDIYTMCLELVEV